MHKYANIETCTEPPAGAFMLQLYFSRLYDAMPLRATARSVSQSPCVKGWCRYSKSPFLDTFLLTNLSVQRNMYFDPNGRVVQIATLMYRIVSRSTILVSYQLQCTQITVQILLNFKWPSSHEEVQKYNTTLDLRFSVDCIFRFRIRFFLSPKAKMLSGIHHSPY